MSGEKTPNWALWARVVGLACGLLPAVPLWKVGHPVWAVFFGVLAAVIFGSFFRAIADSRWFATVVLGEPDEELGPRDDWSDADREWLATAVFPFDCPAETEAEQRRAAQLRSIGVSAGRWRR